MAGTTTYSYNFGSGGTVDGTATLSINGQAVVIPGAGETVAALQGQVNALGISGVSAGLTGNVLTITVPTSMAAGMTAASSMVGDLTGTTSNFDFNTGGTVDPTSTNLLISGQTATGASATITAPTITAGESITDYASALTTQLGNAGITNATVSYVPGANQLSITGANLSTTGGVSQDLAATTTNYDFGSDRYSRSVDQLLRLPDRQQPAPQPPSPRRRSRPVRTVGEVFLGRADSRCVGPAGTEHCGRDRFPPQAAS